MAAPADHRIADAAGTAPDEIAEVVTGMLTDLAARERAPAVKAEIDALPDVEAVVPRLEQLTSH